MLSKPNSIQCAASVIEADLMRLGETFSALEAAGCDELCFEVGDARVSQDFLLGPRFIHAAKACCNLPCTAYLQTEQTDEHVARFLNCGCSRIVVHVETLVHGHRALSQIRDAGIKTGVAILPATPLTKLDYLLDSADRVVLLLDSKGPFSKGQVRAAFDRVRLLKENLAYRELQTQIEIGSELPLRDCALLAKAGATVFKLGALNLYGKEDMAGALAQFRTGLAQAQNLV